MSAIKPTPASPAPLAWITGAGGLIGSHLARVAPESAPGWRVAALTRADLDLLDSRAVRDGFHREEPALLIHCAALSRSADCQRQPGLARRLNIEVTRLLADLAQAIPLLFFSTDLVFDGQRGDYDEAASVHPLSVYGETKAAAESVVLANPLHTVIRTSLNYGASPTGDRAFNEDMARAWRAGQTTRLFTDEFRSPIPAVVTAQAAWELALSAPPSLYHVAGAERLSRWQIGQLLAARWSEGPPLMAPCSLAEYQGPPRAPDTSLNCAKAHRLLRSPLPRFSAWLDSPSRA